MNDDKLLRRCYDFVSRFWSVEPQTAEQLLQDLDAALAGKDAEQDAAPLTSPSVAPADSESGSAVGSVGAAPGLPEEPDSMPCYEETDRVNQEWIAYAEKLSALYLRVVEERDGLLRGEFICKQCGLRKDSKQEPPTW